MAKTVDPKKLLAVKDQIDQAKLEVERATGKRQQIVEQMEEKFKVSTVAEASTLLEEMEKEIEEMDEEIDDLAEKLRTDFNFDI